MPKSPCSKVCRYETGTDICIGCGRSAEEITAWSTATKERKTEIIKEAKKRLKK
jgi:predicted Fe-S protein YdhL (DUF1289 family)